MAERKIPMRKCLGCGEMLPQKELVRVVKTKIKAGQWCAVLNCHAIVTDSVKYEITVEAGEGTQ